MGTETMTAIAAKTGVMVSDEMGQPYRQVLHVDRIGQQAAARQEHLRVGPHNRADDGHQPGRSIQDRDDQYNGRQRSGRHPRTDSAFESGKIKESHESHRAPDGQSEGCDIDQEEAVQRGGESQQDGLIPQVSHCSHPHHEPPGS